jgi:hypothetical protein
VPMPLTQFSGIMMSSERPTASASAKPKMRVAPRFHTRITPSASA